MVKKQSSFVLGTDLWGIKPGHDNGRIAINLRALAAFFKDCFPCQRTTNRTNVRLCCFWRYQPFYQFWNWPIKRKNSQSFTTQAVVAQGSCSPNNAAWPYGFVSQNGANGIKSFFRRGKGYLTAGDFANEVGRELISEVSNACVVVQFYPKSRSKRSRYSSENDVLIEKSVKYMDFCLLSIVYVW